MALTLCPITLREAHAFVTVHHRHHRRSQGALFAVAAEADGEIKAVAVIGRPVARAMQDGYTAEVVRLCSDGSRNACSLLYGAAWRAARSRGYRRLVTYTLDTEPGTSLVGAGWRLVGAGGGGSWSCKSRPRVDTHPTQGKLRWERSISRGGA